MNFTKNKLQVLHYPQIPCKPFRVDVNNELEAKKIIDVLAEQHLFLYDNNIIGDYSNAITLVMYENNEWVNYYNEKENMEWEEFEEVYLNASKSIC